MHEAEEVADVVIVGAGVAGSLAALMLGRAGYAVRIIDLHAVPPDDFRVEKVVGPQIAGFARLGLLERLEATATRVAKVVSADRGRLLDASHEPHFSLSYRELVELVRAAIPANVRTIFARVQEIETGPDRQAVTLSDGRKVLGRLVILASGQADLIRERLGIARRTLVEGGTLAFGFDLAPSGSRAFRFAGLTYYGENGRFGVDYLALLAQRGLLRANLFAFCDHRQAWIGELRREPTEALRRLLPGLERALGGYVVAGRVSMFIMRIVGVDRHERDGVVLIGDAFQTSCPAAGTGLSRLLVDVEQLCLHHLPGWLGTPGMGRDKIAAFYADPHKRASDLQAIAKARLRRAITLQKGFGWKLRRHIHFLRRRVVGAMKPGGLGRPMTAPATDVRPQA